MKDRMMGLVRVRRFDKLGRADAIIKETYQKIREK